MDPVTKTKRERVREAWRETLQRLADRLPEVDIPPPQEDDPEDSRGSEIPSLTSEPIPE